MGGLVGFSELGNQLGAERVGTFDDERIRMDRTDGEDRSEGEGEEVFHF